MSQLTGLQNLHSWLENSMRETKTLSQHTLEPYCPEEGRPTVFFSRRWHSCRPLLSVYSAVWAEEIKCNANIQTTTTLEKNLRYLSQSMGLILHHFNQSEFLGSYVFLSA